MKLVIFGATGGTGREVMFQALDRGHEVKAVARKPWLIEADHGNLAVVRANALNAQSVAEVVAGAEGVISALGSAATLRQGRRPTTIYSDGFRFIVEAVRKHSVRRFIAVTSAGTIEDPSEPFFYKRILKPLLRATYEDMAKAENFMRGCDDLDWIVVRPPRLLDCPRRGKYRTGLDVLPKGGIEVGRADLAAFLLDQLHSDEHLRKFATIGY